MKTFLSMLFIIIASQCVAQSLHLNELVKLASCKSFKEFDKTVRSFNFRFSNHEGTTFKDTNGNPQDTVNSYYYVRTVQKTTEKISFSESFRSDLWYLSYDTFNEGYVNQLKGQLSKSTTFKFINVEPQQSALRHQYNSSKFSLYIFEYSDMTQVRINQK